MKQPVASIPKEDVVVVGGGLGGLVSTLHLARAGVRVRLLEKKTHPFHRVCGEYVSNEVLPYLHALGIDVGALGAARIKRASVSSPDGTHEVAFALDLGGFGVSRYRLEEALLKACLKAGAAVTEGTTVREVHYRDDGFRVRTTRGVHGARTVIAAHGKRSSLDRQLERPFMKKAAPWMAVKYHVRADFPNDLIALHNFPGGYCGVSAVEDDCYCVCYLVRGERFAGDIGGMERASLHRNRRLHQFMSNAEILFRKPLVIARVSFAAKKPVENHMLMVGDAAGLVAPLCGNGMAMAIGAARRASNLSLDFLAGGIERQEMERRYQAAWREGFGRRLYVGRVLQAMFGRPWVTAGALAVLARAPSLTRRIVNMTHG